MRTTSIILLFAACVNRAIFEDSAEINNGFGREDDHDYDDSEGQKGNTLALWLEGVNFYFDNKISYKLRSMFVAATKAWMKDTCINFRFDRNAKDVIFVVEKKQQMCSSSTGKKGGKQTMYLNEDCAQIGDVVHEIGHALGLYDVHRRQDRDNYITVNWTNIEKQFDNRYRDQFKRKDQKKYLEEYKKKFEKLSTNESDSYGPYDYGSIMHYASPIENPTITPKDKMYRRTMGSPFISFTDLLEINDLYKCKEKCNSEKSAKCTNGGFPHPRGCDWCICPSGYGGLLCDKKPGKCGEVLKASTDWQQFNYAKQERDFEDEYYTCTYWVEAPNNTKIEVNIENINGTTSDGGCVKAGVEIKTNEDQTLTGYRFCDEDDKNTNLTSHTNIVPIIYYENQNSKIFTTLKYRYISSTNESKSRWELIKDWVRKIVQKIGG